MIPFCKIKYKYTHMHSFLSVQNKTGGDTVTQQWESLDSRDEKEDLQTYLIGSIQKP